MALFIVLSVLVGSILMSTSLYIVFSLSFFFSFKIIIARVKVTIV
jgi:hypothetical protein